MDWLALFGKINYPLALIVIETAICYHYRRRRLCGLWWPLFAAVILVQLPSGKTQNEVSA